MKRDSWTRLASCCAAAVTLWLARPAAADDPVIKFERYRLENGLEVILHQDNRVPLVAVDVWYHVGSGDETPGRSGFAHLFEHMLFQGSKHVGDDRHFEVLKKIGASAVNGSTNTDRTNYFEVVPSHQLETALWLESDRMGYLLPKLTDASFHNQVDVVRNERRQNYDNVPYGRARFAVAEGLYPEGHPYRYLTIGRHEDLTAATVADVTAFYRKWYAPGNATLVLAGDFDTATARQLVQKWFGSFPRTERPAHHAPPVPTISRTRREVVDPFARLRRIEYEWHSPAFYAPGDAELDILAEALAAPGTGRLYKILVHQKQLAQSVAAYQASQQFSSFFAVSVLAKTDADLAAIERIIDEEIDRVRKEPITKREFDRSVINREAGFVWGLEELLARAERLQAYNHYVGRPDFITGDLDRYRTSSPEKVLAAAKKYLDQRRVEVLTTPGAPGSAPTAPAAAPAKGN
ncbi:MAG TPA: pitrilysin family protein [Kofleriaceae bacterium]|nr:pitrilysin family protein [Kofleriaceae bacterium]